MMDHGDDVAAEVRTVVQNKRVNLAVKPTNLHLHRPAEGVDAEKSCVWPWVPLAARS